VKILDFVIYQARHGAAIAGLVNLVLLTTLFVLSGTFQATARPDLYTSFEQLLGTVILLILGPTFLLVYLIAGQRRSMRAAQGLFEAGVSDQGPDIWLRPIKTHIPVIGAGLGLLFALIFNMPVFYLTEFFQSDAQTRSIVIGQIFVWTLVGLTLSYRLHTAFAYNKLGRTVRLDLLDSQPLAPFAKNGADDVLACALILVLSTLQSIDAEFRFGNYATTMLIALPAGGSLFILPMISIHRRLVHSRKEYLEEMDRQIATTSRQHVPEAIQKLELLMLHRDRLREISTWPLDWTIYSRLAFYIVLPPIAWMGAAFAEFGVDRILTDP
jgi:hypothetical protein